MIVTIVVWPFKYYNVYACYDSIEDFDNRKVLFYDLYDCDGNCVNEGDPFYEMPSWREIYEFYWLPTVCEASKDHKRDLNYESKINHSG